MINKNPTQTYINQSVSKWIRVSWLITYCGLVPFCSCWSPSSWSLTLASLLVLSFAASLEEEENEVEFGDVGAVFTTSDDSALVVVAGWGKGKSVKKGLLLERGKASNEKEEGLEEEANWCWWSCRSKSRKELGLLEEWSSK